MEQKIIPAYGRGFQRMLDKLGPDRAEELRLQVMQEQAAALARAGQDREATRDRETYREYPIPKARGRRRKTTGD